MKKFLQNIFSHKTIDVVDATTGEQQKATYVMLFGLPLNINYKSK